MITSAFLNALQIHGSANGIGLNKSARALIPRVDTVDRPRDHGSVDFTSYYSGQTWTLGGRVKHDTDPTQLEPLIDQIRAQLWLDNGITFKIQRNGIAVAEQCVVVCRAVDFPIAPENRLLVPFTMELFAADPRLYNQAQTTTSQTATGATTFPAFNVTNNGNVKTPVVWTVTGPINANFVIHNATTGHDIKINTALAGGHTLVIDTYAKTVLLDGTTEHPEYVDAANTFWDGLAAGVNSIQITSGVGMTNGVTALQAVFRDARG